jgi:polyisoprenoid-binding protein YceI
VKGTLIIDAASFTTKNKKRDDHLRSDVILAVVKYLNAVHRNARQISARPAVGGAAPARLP